MRICMITSGVKISIADAPTARARVAVAVENVIAMWCMNALLVLLLLMLCVFVAIAFCFDASFID